MEVQISGANLIIASVLVLYLGSYLTQKIAMLRRYNIPPAVTGGLLCSVFTALCYSLLNVEYTFSLEIRDLLLLVFFSTVGLNAKFSQLASGGKALFKLLILASLFLVIQNVAGVILAKILGGDPLYGLFAGSVSFAGGHGTAIAWGTMMEEKGLQGAQMLGIACATFGLIAGGMVGGPVARFLIQRHGLKPGEHAGDSNLPDQAGNEPAALGKVILKDKLNALLALALCVQIGSQINDLLQSTGLMLPGFLTAMFVGIIISNFSNIFRIKLNKVVVDNISEISLQLFLSMSLMSLQLWTLFEAMTTLVVIILLQVTVITVFAVFIVFRVMGRDYDACVIASGFTGMGLGATPVAIANMSAVTAKHGPSVQAFLVVPLVGAFFVDITNAFVIQFFLNYFAG